MEKSYFYVGITRDEETYNLGIGEGLYDINQEPFKPEDYADHFMTMFGHIEQVKVFEFNGRMKCIKTITKKR